MSKNQNLASLTPDATLDQIISADRGAGQLLASIGLKPSNHKKETLRSVCQQRRWSEVEVLQWIKKNGITNNRNSEAQDTSEQSYFGENLSQWCNYVEETYHKKIFQLLKEISSNFPRVRQIHDNEYSWLKNVQWHFNAFEDKLQFYIYFESKKFFPIVKSLNSSTRDLLDGTIQKLFNGLEIISEDQNDLLKLMGILEEKGRGFANPPLACSTLRILNYHLKTMCSTLQKQFEIEQEFVVPLIKQKLRSL